MSEELERHGEALEAELVVDPNEKAKVEARNGVRQFDAVIELIEYFSDLGLNRNSPAPPMSSLGTSVPSPWHHPQD